MIIKNIINRFYNLAKEHNYIKSFTYDRLSKGAGLGDEKHPHFFLEDPIYIHPYKPLDGKVKVTVNFNIVLTPQSLENWNIKQPSTAVTQSVAHMIANNMVAKIRDDYTKFIEQYNQPDYFNMEIIDYSFVTLKNWYDNKAEGVRCTINVYVKNDIDLCDIDSNFNPDKELDVNNYLPDITIDEVDGCATFDYKLPNFKL